MFDRLFSKPQCPVDPAARAWLDSLWNSLETRFGLELPRTAQIILPYREYFPDPYHDTDPDARVMLDRVCSYMHIDPAIVELSLCEDQEAARVRRRRQNADLLNAAEDSKLRVWVERSVLADPLALVAAMAHELAYIHLLKPAPLSNTIEDHEPLADLLTVFLGMGVITANAVIRENAWRWGKYFHYDIARHGYLGMPEFGYALARFAQARSENGSAWAHQLRPDVRAPFKAAMRFLAQDQPPNIA